MTEFKIKKQIDTLDEGPSYHLTVPWCPSVNHYYTMIAVGKGARKIIGKKGVEFRKELKTLKKKFEDTPFGKSHFPLMGNLTCEIYLYPPTNRKYDIDNRLKCLLDAMEDAGIYEDDSQITEMYITKEPKVKGGKIEVMLVEKANGYK